MGVDNLGGALFEFGERRERMSGGVNIDARDDDISAVSECVIDNGNERRSEKMGFVDGKKGDVGDKRRDLISRTDVDGWDGFSVVGGDIFVGVAVVHRVFDGECGVVCGFCVFDMLDQLGGLPAEHAALDECECAVWFTIVGLIHEFGVMISGCWRISYLAATF